MGLAGVDRGWEFYKIGGTKVSDMEEPWQAFNTDSEVDFTFITTSNDTVERSMTRTDYEIKYCFFIKVYRMQVVVKLDI